jgi:hypothetical protein
MVPRMSRAHRILVLALSGLLLMPVLTACGKDGKEPKTANVSPGEMPAGGEWSGVYYDPFYGNLHLVAEGDKVTGKWRTEAGDSWGELSGTIDGNLLRYEWVEHKIGMIGASAQTKGKGYFVYKEAENPNDPDVVEGERGLGDSEVGSKWKGVKQNNVVPDPDSMMPDENERHGTSDGWDSGEGKSSADKGGDEPNVFGGGGGDDEDEGSDDEGSSGDDGDTDF